MADAEVEQKQRKSVAFSEGSVIMDTNGQVTDAPAAEKPADKEVDEMTDMFKGLSKKKKSKKSSKETGDAEEPTADGEFDASALKKKKKKTKKDAGDFEAKLAEAGIDEEGDKEQAEEALPEGDAEAGTGIWAHDATQVIPYPLLVSRFFTLVQSHHPDLLASGTKAYKIPPPQCLREGNRRTVFANIAEICARMKRSDEHVTQFLFAELGTSGSVDGSKRLVIKGRFQGKQLESVLRKYIVEYVTCKTCRSPNTELNKGENRLYFITCNSCGSRRSVAAIKTGFRSQVGRRKRVG
ncbi:eukaryotic translation initiation factor 2 subunit beta [Penicillium cataractarum]|uniref:Eukaryotic translation initiation factor 2 subunit beta n=1 Tax=Penicillium cataractarum TaxID=2100454 RepID=A0A9W9SFW7_9EURO|nr:eukaryotic translation initiation factor 2 subunit beta [Penicillium cataractarum]KAJ5377372.1 eukaryotic translation initiation factor 2 subunit beta [Penicillium cataractarum]